MIHCIKNALVVSCISYALHAGSFVTQSPWLTRHMSQAAMPFFNHLTGRSSQEEMPVTTRMSGLALQKRFVTSPPVFKNLYGCMLPNQKIYSPIHALSFDQFILGWLRFGDPASPVKQLLDNSCETGLFYQQDGLYSTRNRSLITASLDPNLAGEALGLIVKGEAGGTEDLSFITKWEKKYEEKSGLRANRTDFENFLYIARQVHTSNPELIPKIFATFVSKQKPVINADNSDSAGRKEMIEYVQAVDKLVPCLRKQPTWHRFLRGPRLQPHEKYSATDINSCHTAISLLPSRLLVKTLAYDNFFERTVIAQATNQSELPPALPTTSIATPPQALAENPDTDVSFPNCGEISLLQFAADFSAKLKTKGFDPNRLAGLNPTFKDILSKTGYADLSNPEHAQAITYALSGIKELEYNRFKDTEYAHDLKPTINSMLKAFNYVLGIQAKDFSELASLISSDQLTVTAQKKGNVAEFHWKITKEKKRYTSRLIANGKHAVFFTEGRMPASDVASYQALNLLQQMEDFLEYPEIPEMAADTAVPKDADPGITNPDSEQQPKKPAVITETALQLATLAAGFLKYADPSTVLVKHKPASTQEALDIIYSLPIESVDHLFNLTHKLFSSYGDKVHTNTIRALIQLMKAHERINTYGPAIESHDPPLSCTILHYGCPAVIPNELVILQEAIKSGANVNLPLANATPLGLTNSVKGAQELLKAGARVHSPAPGVQSPLETSILLEHPLEKIKLLVDRGAPVTNRELATAMTKHPEAFEFFKEHLKPKEALPNLSKQPSGRIQE